MFMQDAATFAPDLSTRIPAPARTGRPALSGLLTGTLVETASGWQRVETLTAGTRVQTLDGGLARLLRLHRHLIRPEDAADLIHLPGVAAAGR